MLDSLDNVYYYLNDHLGSAGVLITSTGTVRDKYKYKPFGDKLSSSVQVGQAYRYTGKPLDEEFDLDWYYYGARYYDPSIGRFLAVDPLHGKYPGWGSYVYCRDNPIKLIDPDGKADDKPKQSTITEHMLQKTADIICTAASSVSLKVKAGIMAGIKLGAAALEIGSSTDVTLNADGVQDVTVGSGVKAEIAGGQTSLKAEARRSLMDGGSQVGVTASALDVGGSVVLQKGASGQLQLNAGTSMGGSNGRISDNGIFSIGASLGPVGAELNIDLNAGQNAPDISRSIQTFRSLRDMIP